MSGYDSRYDGNGEGYSSAHSKGGDHGGSSPYDAFEDRDSLQKVRTILVNQIVRGRGLESGIEIGKKIETAVIGTTKIEAQGLIEEGADMVIMTVTGLIMTGIAIMIEVGRGDMDIDHVPVLRIDLVTGLNHGLDPVLVQKASGQAVLTWHHLLLRCCLVLLFQAMLGYMSHRAAHGRDHCRLYVQRGTNASISWILFAFNRPLLPFGQLPGVPQTAPGMLQNMFPFGTTQLGALPLMPAQAMTQQATRHARRVYVGGLPPLANEQTIATFFSRVMAAIGGNAAGPGDAVVNVYINHEKKFAFVEMRTVEEASNAMALDGIMFEGVSVRVRRPTDYNPSLAAALGPSQPSPHLNLAAVGLAPGAIGGAEGPDRIFVGGLPYYFTEAQIRELLESFGPLRGFDLVKDRDTGNSKGYGFCVYQDPAVTDIACGALNGLKMGDKTLTVRRATVSSGQAKSEQENILAQAQQHIAIQKMVLQAGGLSVPGGVATAATEETPTKVLCLTEAITPDELKDNEEYEEILEDMRDECGKFGALVDIIIPRPNPNGEQTPGVGKVFLEYSDTTSCASARNVLNGRKFGGNTVSAVYFPEDKFYNRDYSE